MSEKVGFDGHCIVLCGDWCCDLNGIWRFEVDKFLVSRAVPVWEKMVLQELEDAAMSEFGLVLKKASFSISPKKINDFSTGARTPPVLVTTETGFEYFKQLFRNNKHLNMFVKFEDCRKRVFESGSGARLKDGVQRSKHSGASISSGSSLFSDRIWRFEVAPRFGHSTEYYLVALCEKDNKENLQKLLEIVDITKVSSPDALKSIFEYLGKSLSESVAMRLLWDLRDCGKDGVETVSNLISNYATCISNSTNKSREHKGAITPQVLNSMRKGMMAVKGSEVHFITNGSYEVVGMLDGTHNVFLKQKRCTCVEYDKVKIPCGHAMLAANAKGATDCEISFVGETLASSPTVWTFCCLSPWSDSFVSSSSTAPVSFSEGKRYEGAASPDPVWSVLSWISELWSVLWWTVFSSAKSS